MTYSLCWVDQIGKITILDPSHVPAMSLLDWVGTDKTMGGYRSCVRPNQLHSQYYEVCLLEQWNNKAPLLCPPLLFAGYFVQELTTPLFVATMVLSQDRIHVHEHTTPLFELVPGL